MSAAPIIARTFHDLDSLINCLTDLREDARLYERETGHGAVENVYVKDRATGHEFQRATVIRNVLTDGSCTYDIELS